MKLLILMSLFAFSSCQNKDEFYTKDALALSKPSVELPVSTPTNPDSQNPEILEPSLPIVKVCKMETAPNFDPRQSDANTIVVGDNSLCEKVVCVKEHEETPFEVVVPEKVTFGCQSAVSEQDYEVTLGWAADDASRVYMDGKEFGDSSNWQHYNEKTVTLKGGCHTLAIHAVDLYAMISGVLGYLKVDGQVVWRTGDSNEFLKAYGPQNPPADWKELNFNETGWKGSSSCEDISPWGDFHSDLRTQGSKWIWWSANCKNLTQAFFRLSFSLTAPSKALINDDKLCKE